MEGRCFNDDDEDVVVVVVVFLVDVVEAVTLDVVFVLDEEEEDERTPLVPAAEPDVPFIPTIDPLLLRVPRLFVNPSILVSPTRESNAGHSSYLSRSSVGRGNLGRSLGRASTSLLRIAVHTRCWAHRRDGEIYFSFLSTLPSSFFLFFIFLFYYNLLFLLFFPFTSFFPFNRKSIFRP